MTPHKYQLDTVRFLHQRFTTHRGAGVLADPGLGKTLITLLYLEDLKLTTGVKALVVAPKYVCETVWRQEAEKWGIPLTFASVFGPEAKRLAALGSTADAYLTTPDLIPWLTQITEHAFDMLIVDESTKFKNYNAKRSAALRVILPMFRRRLILTGTPAANALADMFGQIFILDDGEMLGRTLRYFQRHWMRPHPAGFGWVFRTKRIDEFQRCIGSMVRRLDRDEYLEMPELLIHDILVDLPPGFLKQYKQFEKLLFLALSKDKTLVATNAGVRYQLCKGLANGGCYEHTDNGRMIHHTHRAKLNALVNLVDELNGKPMLTFFSYDHDLERIQKAYPNAPVIGGKHCTVKNAVKLIARWNNGDIIHLLAQPASMGHGLNLQHGPCRDICWFGLPDNADTYHQAYSRVWRQGQRAAQIRMHRILARDTVDLLIRKRLESKNATQQSFLTALKGYLSSAAEPEFITAPV